VRYNTTVNDKPKWMQKWLLTIVRYREDGKYPRKNSFKAGGSCSGFRTRQLPNKIRFITVVVICFGSLCNKQGNSLKVIIKNNSFLTSKGLDFL
jgi:hypothetical protein